jgi:hypothetical protein
MLPLCLLLQTLHLCTAAIADCQDLVKRLNADQDTAKEVRENWESCGPEFLQGASNRGVNIFFTAFEKSSLAFPKQIAQDIADKGEFACKVSVEQLETLIKSGATISSEFFAKVKNIESFNQPKGLNERLTRYKRSTGYERLTGFDWWSPRQDLPDDILEYYDGPMKDTSWITTAQLKLFGSKLDKEILCTELKLSGREQPKFLESINLKCFRGLLRSSESARNPRKIISLNVMDEWIKEHLEEDFEHINHDYLEALPIQAWKKVLELPQLLEKVSEVHLTEVKGPTFGAALPAIDHARFAEIAIQRPELAKKALDLLRREISPNIFASCGKEEMKVFLSQLEGIYVDMKPLIVINISSALPDEHHFCNGMSFETYRSMPWLYRYASPRCMSLITVPNGEDAEEFLKELRTLHTGIFDEV